MWPFDWNWVYSTLCYSILPTLFSSRYSLDVCDRSISFHQSNLFYIQPTHRPTYLCSQTDKTPRKVNDSQSIHHNRIRCSTSWYWHLSLHMVFKDWSCRDSRRLHLYHCKFMVFRGWLLSCYLVMVRHRVAVHGVCGRPKSMPSTPSRTSLVQSAGRGPGGWTVRFWLELAYTYSIPNWSCWWFRNPANQMRLAVDPIIFLTRFCRSQVVVWDFCHQQYKSYPLEN